MKKKALGTYDIAKIFHVTPATVGRWVNLGKLPYFKTGGGHRRVWSTAVVDFLKAHNMPVPEHLLEGDRPVILVVDDQPVIRRLVGRVIKRLNTPFAVHEAKDGFEAGQKVTLLTPDLVILDLKLPGINGIDLCARIKKDENLKKTKILAISGYDIKHSRDQVLDAGADIFLAKPFQPDDLVEKLQILFPFLKKNKVPV